MWSVDIVEGMKTEPEVHLESRTEVFIFLVAAFLVVAWDVMWKIEKKK